MSKIKQELQIVNWMPELDAWPDGAVNAIETDMITKLLADKEREILPERIDLLKKSGALETGRINASETVDTLTAKHLLKTVRQRA